MINYRENEEHDSCAIVAYVRKDGNPAHGTLKRAINGLEKMGHRSGGVDAESKPISHANFGASPLKTPR